jgi:DNA-binding transcriptional LysR family regulator
MGVMMRDLDWKIIYELYKNPNLTQVSKILYVTQPTLTKRLKQVEEELGVEIVNRTPKGLSLTEAGEYVGNKAEEYLRFRREVDEGLQNLRLEKKEFLKIGSAYTFSKYSLKEFLDPFAQEHPNISYRITNKQSDILYAMLLERTIDAAFVRGDYTQGVNSVRLPSTTGYLVTRLPVVLPQLPKMNRITYQTSSRTTELLNTWWKDWFGETTCREGFSAGYIDFALDNLTYNNDYLLCFLPEGKENDRNLVLMPLVMRDGTPVERSTWFLYRNEKRISRTLETFIGFVEKAACR